jgi:hypothetical protein
MNAGTDAWYIEMVMRAFRELGGGYFTGLWLRFPLCDTDGATICCGIEACRECYQVRKRPCLHFGPVTLDGSRPTSGSSVLSAGFGRESLPPMRQRPPASP